MNPFRKDGYMLPVASINSVYIDDTLASDIFSPRLLISEIDRFRTLLTIDKNVKNHDLLLAFNDLLANKKMFAEKIAYKYANRLAKVLITLKKPSDLSIENRENWNSSHWDYWNNINHVYLVGGLTSIELNNIFSKVISDQIKENNIDDFVVEIISDSANYGTLGLLSKNNNNQVLLFDFGQSFIKRGFTKLIDDKYTFDDSLPPIESKFIQYKGYSECDLKASSKTLHNYIVECIVDTVNSSKFTGNLIEISIANYIYKGKIHDSRGGYAKLHLVDDNYEEYLNKCVTKILNKDIKINLYHDTTSMSFMFDKNNKEAVISLGTGFGVSFLD